MSAPGVSPLPRWVIATLAVGILVALVYYTGRAVSHTRKHAADPAVQKDFDHFYHAAAAGRNGEDIYESYRKGYIYPPLYAAIVTPLASFERNGAYLVWFTINAGLIGLSVVLCARTLLERFGIESRAGPTVAIVGIGTLLTFDQTRWQLEHGQTDGLLLLAFVLGLRWLDRRPIAAGLAMGVAANIKYLTLVSVPFGMIRGRWRLLAGVTAGCVLGAAFPAVVFGVERNTEYLRTSLGRLVHVIDPGPDLVNTGGINIHSLTWELNVSLPAFAAKTVERLGLPDRAVAGMAGLLGLGLVAAAWGLYVSAGRRFWRGPTRDAAPRERRELAVLEWLGLVVVALAMSPQTTVRHMVLMVMVYQCAAVMAIYPRRGAPRWLALGAAVVAWLGMTLPPGGGNTWSSQVALPAWRSVSGAMWGALVAYAGLLFAGLRYVNAGQNIESVSPSGSSTPR
ncbi:MAG: glycosyltransferase family 87 protein [Phycisphaerales bacterium]